MINLKSKRVKKEKSLTLSVLSSYAVLVQLSKEKEGIILGVKNKVRSPGKNKKLQHAKLDASSCPSVFSSCTP